MSKHTPASVTVEVQWYGLGYPQGYRLSSVDIRFDWKGTPIYLTIETLKNHHEQDHSFALAIIDLTRMCPLNNLELKRLKPQSNGTHAAGEIALDH